MKLQRHESTVTITGLKELGAANAASFRDQVRESIGQADTLEVNLGETMFIDSCGLGSLVSLHKIMVSRGGKVRLLNPTPPVQQILELTRMHRIFEIVTAHNT